MDKYNFTHKIIRTTLTSAWASILLILLLASCQGSQIHDTPTPTYHNPKNPTITSTPEPISTLTPSSTPTKPLASFLPGSYIAYWQDGSLFAKNIRNGQNALLMQTNSPDQLAKLSPDGQKIAYIDSKNNIASYNLSNGSTNIIAEKPSTAFILDLEWSPDSKMLLYSWTEDIIGDPWAKYSINMIDVDTKENLLLVERGAGFEAGVYAPKWSPDGNWILFTGFSFGGDYFIENLYMVNTGCLNNIESCAEQSIEISKGMSAADWSADNILAFSCSFESKFGLCLLDPNEPDNYQFLTSFQELTSYVEHECFGIRWSPDGRHIAFTLLYGENDVRNIDLFIYSFESSKSVNLTNTIGVNESMNNWSPNSDYIDYMGITGWQNNPFRVVVEAIGDIYVTSPDGMEKINITNDPNSRNHSAFWIEIK